MYMYKYIIYSICNIMYICTSVGFDSLWCDISLTDRQSYYKNQANYLCSWRQQTLLRGTAAILERKSSWTHGFVFKHQLIQVEMWSHIEFSWHLTKCELLIFGKKPVSAVAYSCLWPRWTLRTNNPLQGLSTTHTHSHSIMSHVLSKRSLNSLNT